MARICWYFHLHQPWRLRPYRIFDISQRSNYWDTPAEASYDNARVFRKVADKSYRPMLDLLSSLLSTHPDFCFSLSITGTFLEQAEAFAPDVIKRLQQLVATGRVEILAETYYHSLASLYDESEFALQVQLHSERVRELFGVQPQVFRNTELIYTNHIAYLVWKMGFLGMLAEGADRILQGRSPTQVYRAGFALQDQVPAGLLQGEYTYSNGLPLLLKHYQLSDDVAFRFSQQSWSAWPLLAETYHHWVTQPFSGNALINLFMDFETFGEHQWEAHGIFPFFSELIHRLSQDSTATFVTPTQVLSQVGKQTSAGIRDLSDLPVFDAGSPVSWADTDRDITAWVGNPLQADALRQLYTVSQIVLDSHNASLLEDWRRLQTSDHFYYMCTKWANDGDVHAYFSPYGDPYEAYSTFNTVLTDFLMRTHSSMKDQALIDSEDTNEGT